MLLKGQIFDWGDTFPPGVRVKSKITLDMLQAALSNPENGLPTIGIPVKYEREQIQDGGMFKKTFQDCLLVINADHPDDYFKFVFTVRTTGVMTTIEIFHCGSSAYIGKANYRDYLKNSDSGFNKFKAIFTKVDNQAMEEENDYYTLVFDVLKTVLGI